MSGSIRRFVIVLVLAVVVSLVLAIPAMAVLPITDVTVAPISNQTWSGWAKKPALDIKDGEKALIAGLDYIASYSSNIDIGTAQVSISGIGEYSGSTTASFEIVPSLARAYVGSIPNQTWSGWAKKPAIYVKYGPDILVAGVDYTVTYSNNVNIGTAKATITGKGAYGGVKSVSFKIVPSLAKSYVSAIPNQVYTGWGKKPLPVVKYGSRILVSGTDYTLKYSNNVNIGTAKITITGRGNYGGVKTVSFKIAPTIAKASVAAISNQTYSGWAKKPSPVVTLGGKRLVAGTDYTLAYSNNVNIGTAKITITGKGGYAGTKVAYFKIVAKASTATASTPLGSVTPKPGSSYFVTNTGTKYHLSGCRYLATSKIPVDLAEAKRMGFTACKVCF